MQEQVTFKLSPHFDVQSTDADALLRELKHQQQAVEALLTSYHYRSRGRVFDVLIDESSVALISQSMGKFMVKYSIGQFNACADVDFTETEAMEMLVDIDGEKRVAVITGEYIPERDPDEF